MNKETIKNLVKVIKYYSLNKAYLGFCPICNKKTIFLKEGDWLRDNLKCFRCKSIPRNRALMDVLEKYFKNWRELSIHESSPSGPLFKKFKNECKGYIPTYFFKDTELGQSKNDFRCENLEHQTFPDESFDLVITQDVFEHVLNPKRAFKEIKRTLKKGGCHIFTAPWYYWKDTLIRAIKRNNEIINIKEPDFHGNPIDKNGSLVVTEWGKDLCDFIYKTSGMTTTIIRILDKAKGIDGEFIEVFISKK